MPFTATCEAARGAPNIYTAYAAYTRATSARHVEARRPLCRCDAASASCRRACDPLLVMSAQSCRTRLPSPTERRPHKPSRGANKRELDAPENTRIACIYTCRKKDNMHTHACMRACERSHGRKTHARRSGDAFAADAGPYGNRNRRRHFWLRTRRLAAAAQCRAYGAEASSFLSRVLPFVRL